MWYKVNDNSKYLGFIIMVSFLIVSKDKNKAAEEWQKITNRERIDRFDITIVEPEKTMGIGDVRGAQQKLILKPLRSQKKAVILDAYLGITIEAQNALLKSLEEPPLNTIIILLVSDLEPILPTIISRCKVLNLDKFIMLSDDEKNTFTKLFNKIQKVQTGEKLELAQDFGKTKEDGALFTQNLILVLRELILDGEGDTKKLLHTLKEFEKANKILKTSNANPRLTLENLFFSI
ncbi:MAG: hypothetical protein A2W22_02650 [Candidatus Levybacteria bacterium RBG_16_35_11]|nr:MAG: hypothetical protein A2W22_02650 [Candidatus Levybacteria bacterium RBG_16_35_11]